MGREGGREGGVGVREGREGREDGARTPVTPHVFGVTVFIFPNPLTRKHMLAAASSST